MTQSAVTFPNASPLELALADHYATFGLSQDVCHRIAALMSHGQAIENFLAALDIGLVSASVRFSVAADGVLEYRGSLYVPAECDVLPEGLRIFGVLNLSKSGVRDIPAGLAAFAFVPNAATADQAGRVTILPHPPADVPKTDAPRPPKNSRAA